MRTRIPTLIIVLCLFSGIVAPALQVSLPDLNNGNVRWSGHPKDDSAVPSLRPPRRRTELASPDLMVAPSPKPRIHSPMEYWIPNIDLQELSPASSHPSGSGLTRAPPSTPVL